MNNLMSEDERLIHIETKLAHQEFLVEELNQVIYSQQKQITDLENKIFSLVQRVEGALTANDDIRPAGEKPPHY